MNVRNPRPLPSSDLAGIEPAPPAWEADVLALDYARIGVHDIAAEPIGPESEWGSSDDEEGPNAAEVLARGHRDGWHHLIQARRRAY